MVKNRSRKKKNHSLLKRWQTWLILGVFCALIVLLVLAGYVGGPFEEDSSLMISDANFTVYFDNSTETVMHNMTFWVFNEGKSPVDCVLNFTISGETYKNNTIIDIPVVQPGDRLFQFIEFDIGEEQDINLESIC